MVRQRSLKAQENNSRLAEAILGVQTRKYKSSYNATKQLKLSKATVTRRVNRGLIRSQAREKQQILSVAQESVLLK